MYYIIVKTQKSYKLFCALNFYTIDWLHPLVSSNSTSHGIIQNTSMQKTFPFQAMTNQLLHCMFRGLVVGFFLCLIGSAKTFFSTRLYIFLFLIEVTLFILNIRCNINHQHCFIVFTDLSHISSISHSMIIFTLEQ